MLRCETLISENPCRLQLTDWTVWSHCVNKDPFEGCLVWQVGSGKVDFVWPWRCFTSKPRRFSSPVALIQPGLHQDDAIHGPNNTEVAMVQVESLDSTYDLWPVTSLWWMSTLGRPSCLCHVAVTWTTAGGVGTGGHSVELSFHFYSWMVFFRSPSNRMSYSSKVKRCILAMQQDHIWFLVPVINWV